MISKSKTGFSLIELLVVISIMAILAGIGYISFRSARGTARDGRRQADLKNIQTAVETYVADSNGLIPCDQSQNSRIYKSYVAGDWQDLSDLLGDYYSAKFLPEDPMKGSTIYYYQYACNKSEQVYALRAKMERNTTIMEDDHGCKDDWWEIGADLEVFGDCQ